MQDRFRFRVWNKEDKCMYYPTRYSNFSIVNGVIVKIESYLTGNGVYRGKRVAYEFDDAVLMQCTGRKDKNGKLIYEGDVVNGSCGVYWGKMIVEYNVAGFVLNKNGKYLNFLEGDNYIEVIGNIYENKSLLGSEG